MVKPLIHDPLFLGVPSEAATQADLPAARDLLDTLTAHRDTCVGMAANMIGIRKRIIAFVDVNHSTPVCVAMLNPEILAKSGQYETEESCLSLLGGPRKCTRYERIKVRYQTLTGKSCTTLYTGFTAQIIQHEIDHCNGVLI